jgi:hypothetical protein
MQDVYELSTPQTSVMEKNTLVQQTKTIVSESDQKNCSASKDQQLHSHDISSNNILDQQLLTEQFSKKWTEFSNSINNLGLVLQKDISETTIKYLTILTKNIQSKVTPSQAIDFVINSSSR